MNARFCVAIAAGTAFSLCAVPAAVADGPFIGVKLNRTEVDFVQTAQPGAIQATRTKPALFAGYRFGNGFEVALEHWSARTGFATCPPGIACPLILVAVPTRTRLLQATAGYEWVLSGAWTIAARGGIESARFDLASTPANTETSAMAGITGRYHFGDGWSVGLDASASGSETRSVGAVLRFDF